MTLRFPSGRVSITAQELRTTRHSQPSCGICNKPWIFESHGCICGQLRMFHPCQHLVGSDCWGTVPNGQKEKYPVCKVKIQCDEGVRVSSAFAAPAVVSRAMDLQMCGLEECMRSGDDGALEDEVENERGEDKDIETSSARENEVREDRKEGLRLNDDDLDAISYFMSLRSRRNASNGHVAKLLPTVRTAMPAHKERLLLFLNNTPQCGQQSEQKSVDLALSAFNIARGTAFTVQDLRRKLNSAKRAVKALFPPVIFEEDEKDKKDAVAVKKLERKLAEVKAELSELRSRQARDWARENAQRLDDHIKRATDEMEMRAEMEVGRLRAQAGDALRKIYATLVADIGGVRERVKKDAAMLRSHRNTEE